jgi:2-polyprenyl-6-methoxyphenol hydroxylase-like FAD-dependent oxidoreductase
MAGRSERTRVAIVGAGPSGLLVSHLLSLEGIESVVLERRSMEDCLPRVRAGILEHEVAAVLNETGIGERMWTAKRRARSILPRAASGGGGARLSRAGAAPGEGRA